MAPQYWQYLMPLIDFYMGGRKKLLLYVPGSINNTSLQDAQLQRGSSTQPEVTWFVTKYEALDGLRKDALKRVSLLDHICADLFDMESANGDVTCQPC